MEDILLTAFAIIVILVLSGCLYSFLQAIFLFVFSGGKEDKKKKGRNSIRFMIIGLLLSIVLMVSFPYIIKSMGVELEQEYTTKRVFTRAGELFKKLFEIGDIVKKAQKENEYRGNPYYDINGTSDTTTLPSQTNTSYDL